jgi:hypothetical protein
MSVLSTKIADPLLAKKLLRPCNLQLAAWNLQPFSEAYRRLPGEGVEIASNERLRGLAILYLLFSILVFGSMSLPPCRWGIYF